MYEFRSEGMSCASCVRAITNAVKEMDPDAQVSVDLNTQKVSVESKQELAQVARVLEEEGYPVLESRKI